VPQELVLRVLEKQSMRQEEAMISIESKNNNIKDKLTLYLPS